MLLKHQPQHIKTSAELQQAEPLWQRVPTRSADGNPVADFMMIIRHLNRCTAAEQQLLLNKIHSVLDIYHDFILLADLNFKINILWVSHLARPGLGFEIAAHVHHEVPVAKLISQQYV